jgi:DNA-binding XRE family transcriptional regulator
MDTRALMAQLVYQGYTTAKLAEILGVSKTTMYRKLYGESEFTRCEIEAIIKELRLDSERIVTIFFPQYAFSKEST